MFEGGIDDTGLSVALALEFVPAVDVAMLVASTAPVDVTVAVAVAAPFSLPPVTSI